MRYLLDTHTFLWWIIDDPRLPVPVRALIQNPENRIIFSVASAWEISIKTQLGRLVFEDDIAEFIPRQISRNGFDTLPIGLRHTLEVFHLPPLHRDPFDRLLVAQARTEGLPLLTADPLIAQYAVQVVW